MYIYIYWTKQTYIYKGPTIRLLRGGGGGDGGFQKKYSCRLFSYTEKQINLLWLFILEKTSYTVVCRGKISSTRGLEEKIFTQTKSPIARLKS